MMEIEQNNDALGIESPYKNRPILNSKEVAQSEIKKIDDQKYTQPSVLDELDDDDFL